MPPRAITAVAVLATAFVGFTGPVAGQSPPEAAPVGRALGGFGPNEAFHYGSGPVEPAIAPIQGVAPPTPAPGSGAPVPDPTISYGPSLPTDSLMGGMARGPKAWLGAEYLIFWTKNAPLSAPIATAGPAGGTGLLSQPGTMVVVGNSPLDYSNFSGVRVVGGYWLTNNESLGIEGNFFILPEKRSGTAPLVGIDIAPTLARPFFNTAQNAEASRVLTRPNISAGGIRVDATQELWGAEIGPVWRFFDNGNRVTFDALTGFKFLKLDEGLTITDFAAAQRGGIAVFQGRGFPSPATTFVSDTFETDNSFYGGVIGLRSNYHVEAFTFSLTGKLGLGTMNQAIRVGGSTTLAGGSPSPTTTGGGFFSTSANSGRFERDEFTVVPELLANVSVQVTRSLTLTVGYNYMCVTDVVRPGDQLSTQINATLVPTSPNFGARFGPPATTVPFRTTDFWAQGINVGIIATY